MRRRLLTSGVAAWGVMLILAPGARAGVAEVTDAADRQILAKFARHAERVPDRMSAEYCRRMAADEPEGYTWKILPQVGMLLTAHELTGQRKYLDLFVRTVANLRGAMTKGADGYLGWYGKPLGLFRNPGKPDLRADVIISSFQMVKMLCRFIEIVDKDKALAARYAKPRAAYVALMTDHLVKKWVARGSYVAIGEKGAIFRTHAGLRDVKASLTQPHNKHSKILQALCALYRVTGRDEYMRMAVQLGVRFKHCLTLKAGHYEWNYWDPAGAWDVHPGQKGQWKHWIGPEHRSGYYSLSLTQAVVMYHHGLVFDRTDLGRFLKTQLEMAWNGDLERPAFFRVDRSKGKQTGEYMCAALAPFGAKIREYLYTGARQAERLKRADHSWQGGPVASGYLVGKFIHGPRAAGGKRVYEAHGKRFLSKAENRKFVASLVKAVAGAGYRAPAGPGEMKPMPAVRGGR